MGRVQFILADWWFGTFFIFHFIYGMSSFPLTIFQRGRYATNQLVYCGTQNSWQMDVPSHWSRLREPRLGQADRSSALHTPRVHRGASAEGGGGAEDEKEDDDNRPDATATYLNANA